MRKITILYILLFHFISFSFAFTPLKSKADSDMRLNVSGRYLVNSKGNKVVLHGVSLGWHNWHYKFYTPEIVQHVKSDWNANIIRAAMGVEPKNAYLKKPQQAVSYITAVADAAIDADMYVIIDWHSHNRYPEDAKAFFTKMAKRYKGMPNVMYEIYNEPIEDSWEEVKEYAEEIIQSIRAIDKEAIIIVGTPHWDQDVHIAAENPIVGYKNIMYSLHFYAGSHQSKIREQANDALQKGLPLFVSECASMDATGDGPINIEEWNRWVSWMKQNDISWIAWSVSDKKETCSMFLPHFDDLKTAVLSPWGNIIKAHLQKNNQFIYNNKKRIQ